jgi:glycosyltransferase involved in cell wall biosynthesis
MATKADAIRVCFFPGRESSYVRSRVLLKGLRQAGLIVYDCSHPARTSFRYFIGFFRFLRFKHHSDIIFIGFFGQFLVPVVRLFTRKRIIFDTFLSAYQTLAFDRQSIRPCGFRAAIVRSIERLACQQANLCLLDTNQHIEYFVKQYRLDRDRFRRSLLGADDSISSISLEFTSNTEPNRIIQFHGEFQALHGVKYVIGAAELLPDVKFRLIGAGKELKTCMDYSKEREINNVEFIPSVPHSQIPKYISTATICLGIFGDTEKTQLVIPFKVYEALALGKPVITADTPAIRELLTHGKDVFLCNTAASDHLAWAIRTLLEDDELRNKIAANGYQTYLRKCTPEKIGRDIASLCGDLLRQ